MYNILCINKISPTGTNHFTDKYSFSGEIKNPDAVLVRSASMHETELNPELVAISRAGAGVNNIPVDKCSENGIVVFNTPGANANAVKELVLASLFMTSRKIIPAIEWTKTLKDSGDEISKLVEKGKGAFTGPEIKGKTLGVIGLGAIGILVANAAKSLGMNVYGYDPYLSVESAWGLSRSINHAYSMDDIFSNCDYITLHLPYTKDTKDTIGEENIKKMKDGVRILNFARGELVNTIDLISAIDSGKISAYATDFPSCEMIGNENIISIPHLGASTPESEDNCAEMAVDEVMEYLENGNIINSVNMPSISMTREGGTRICIFHKNVPNTIGLFATTCGKSNINIENMQSKSKGEYAYTILDVSGDVNESAVSALAELEPIIRVRLIK